MVNVDRRTFLQGAAAAAVTASTRAEAATKEKMIGIQVGAVSFFDEGTEKVLDDFQRDAAVNTLFVATFTYGRGIAGRQVPGQPLPDHGKQEYDTGTFYGGNYATIHPEYYKDTVFKARARPIWATTMCCRRFCRPRGSAASRPSAGLKTFSARICRRSIRCRRRNCPGKTRPPCASTILTTGIFF